MKFHEPEFKFARADLPGAASLAIALQGGPDADIPPGGAFSFSESLAAGTDGAAYEIALLAIADAFALPDPPPYDIA